ncbi:MAG: hypothetical protein RSC95_06920 [Anaerovoracaceae bacterium]
MKQCTKKIITFTITTIMVLSIPFSCFAVSDVESKTNNEFGTLTAIITESVVGGRKTVNYSSKTTKNVPTLIAEVEVVLYATGTPI